MVANFPGPKTHGAVIGAGIGFVVTVTTGLVDPQTAAVYGAPPVPHRARGAGTGKLPSGPHIDIERLRSRILGPGTEPIQKVRSRVTTPRLRGGP